MDLELGDCDLIFPHQGPKDGHTFVFTNTTGMIIPVSFFYTGRGCGGEEDKLSGDEIDIEDQLKLIRQFCQNPHLNHLRVDCNHLDLSAYHAYWIWSTRMKELQGSASIKYLEVQNVPVNYVNYEGGLNWLGPFVGMLSSNSSLIGLKVLIPCWSNTRIAPLMHAISSKKTLQLLHMTFYIKDGNIAIEALRLLVALLTKNAFGDQSNTTLRALFMNIVGGNHYVDEHTTFDDQYVNEKIPMGYLSQYHIDHHIVDKEFKPLIEAFTNMLETNETLTTIQIPNFICYANDIIKVLQALEWNQSINNIFLTSDYEVPQDVDKIWNVFLSNDLKVFQMKQVSKRYKEFSREAVFSRLLKLIKFRNDHGNGLNTVDVRRTSLENPQYNVHIQHALKKKYCIDENHGQVFVRPISCRVFLCGFPEAGKTTLRKKMKYILHEKMKIFHPLYSLSKRMEIPSQHVSKRTIGVEVVKAHIGAIELSFWDMGGQDEYHAYHDLVIPNLSDNGSASLFILVCSLATIKDGTKCRIVKSTKAIELELQYWLRFLTSNTRTSRNFKLHVLVVFTHVDHLPKSMNVTRHVEDLLMSTKDKFGDSFHFSSMEYFVNSNSTHMVEPLVDSMAKEVEVVLAKVPNILGACLQMREEIIKWKGDHPCQTIMKWNDFVHMCSKLPIFEKATTYLNIDLAQDICKTIASSLNEGGYIMYFEDLDVIVVDPNWFGTRIIGSIFSIDHKCLDPHTMEPVTNEKGYMEKERLVSLLENSLKDKKGAKNKGHDMTEHVSVDDLICVMKEMNVCFEEQCASNIEKRKKSIFIPATLRDEGGHAQRGQRKLQWNVMGSSSSGSITYIGRRLQCEDLERTFLTPGFFPRLQVVLERKFGSNCTFRLEKNLVAFTEDGMQVLVEHSGDLSSGKFVDGFIDIMVQSLKTFEMTLQFVKQEVMKPIRRLCASPTFGCQGVTLSKSILRPQCVEYLWPCNERRDQAINEGVLIKNVLSKEDFEEYIHHWPDHHGDEARKLLGDVVWNEEIINRRVANMAELTIVLMQDQDIDSIKMKEMESKKVFQFSSLEGLYKKLIVDMGKLGDSIVERVNKHTKETICGMRCEVLEEISKSVNRLIDHSMQLLQRQVPCYVYVTTKDLGTSEWLISSLVPGLKSVQLHFMCEHKGDIYTVDDQNGVALRLESKTLQGLRPYVILGLRIITMLMKVSANVGAGLGSMVPDLERSLLKGVASIIPDISSNIFGPEGTPIEQVNLMKLKNYFNDSEKKIAEQWLVNFLVGRDLLRDFGLQRVQYLDGSNDLAWVCQRHIDEGRRARVLELCPT